MDASSLLDPVALAGRWRLDRAIDDRLAGERSRVEGLLVLTVEEPGRLRWEESGRWTRRNGVVDVRRVLGISQEDDGWSVLFEDGRPFHAWAPGAEVVHPCGADTYRGHVSGGLARWQVRWDVSGPGKDYSMTSVLTPGR